MFYEKIIKIFYSKMCTLMRNINFLSKFNLNYKNVIEFSFIVRKRLLAIAILSNINIQPFVLQEEYAASNFIVVGSYPTCKGLSSNKNIIWLQGEGMAQLGAIHSRTGLVPGSATTQKRKNLHNVQSSAASR